MGPSRTRLPLFLGILLLFFGRDCYAATINYDFNVTWLTTNPDGLAERPTIGINGQWPIPQIEANVGDRIIIDLHNQLGNESTSLHFHGLFMNGTTEMDGVSQVSQCAVPPGSSFTYNFTVEQAGTYWYHSHFKGQYPDGLRGPLIIHDPDDPHLEEYEEEFVITLSDWYHDQMPGLIAWFISIANPTGAEPVPDSALMNETQDFKLPVQAGKTYRLRLVNIGAFAGQYFWIESHTMTIIEVDGVRTQNAEADMIYLTAAQRYDVLVTTKNDISTNFAMVGSMDQDLFDTIPDTLNPNVTGWLVYDDKKDLPSASLVEDFDPFDDFTLIALDGMELLDHVDRTVTLDLKMDNLGDGANYAFFNDITYVSPKVPSLYTALTTGTNATNPAVYGVNSNAFIMSQGEVVEIVLNNDDAGKHPFHLHGHNFQAVVRSDENGGFYDASNMTAMPAVPMRRDVFLISNVLLVRTGSLADFVVRIWLFHCHIEWHVDSGLVATMVEAPLALQDTLTISQDHLAVCAAGNVPTRGNAAGNTDDVLDLTGANVSPPPLPAGFTARGVVALVFSCIAAFLGMAAIVWYGAAPLGPKSAAAAQQRVVEITGGR